MGNESKRRTDQRHDVDAGIRIRPAGSTSEGMPCRLADAGLGGVAVITTEKPQSERIEVEIVNNRGQVVGDPINAEIRYIEELGQGGYRVGCRFEVPEELLTDEDD